jgi:kynurenine formamidase
MLAKQKFKLFDLAQPIGPGHTYVWPYFPDVRWYKVGYHGQHGLATYMVDNLTMHTSSHADAPYHDLEDGVTIDKMPLSSYFGEAVVLNIPKNALETITAQDLKKAKPTIHRGDIVVVVSGWYKKVGSEETFMVRHPGLTPDAADWLVKKKVKALAVDFGSVDHPYQTALIEIRKDIMPVKVDSMDEFRKEWPFLYVHKTLLRNKIALIEYIGGDVGQLLGKRVQFAAMPLKIIGGDASLVRPIAFEFA